MRIIGIIDEDFINYKLPCMVIETPYCTFKCDRENGNQICQNSALANAQKIDISDTKLVERYLNNSITSSICFQGLEPFDSMDLENCIKHFRAATNDIIVIYTGYTEEETLKQFSWIYNYSNIVLKYGRFIPNQLPHFDVILGVNLASNNQYAKEYNIK